MTHKRRTYMKNILLPCFVFSVITGIFTGIVIFLFKVATGYILDFSANLYQSVRERPLWLPLLLVGAAGIGLLSACILRYAPNSRGGGIPTSVAILRGLVEFRWLKSLIALFVSSLLTFLGGVPLGNEGPSVQMGTAIGRGTVRLFARKNTAWDRYIMTGGACGGFAAATGAPLTGIFFALEEAHRRFLPTLFMTAAMTAASATAVMRLLCNISGISPYMFDFSAEAALPLRYLWVAVAVGVACGLIAVAFTKLYAAVGNLVNQTFKRVPFAVKIVLIFMLVALCGFASKGFIGSGHGIIHELLEGQGVWYLLLLYFGVRALFLMFANHAGISGGIFVPTLAFGAIIGALIAKLTVQTGLLSAAYGVIPVIIGMASFLAASSRTPITAITFSLEALCGLSNILPITIGVTLSFLVIETWGVPSLQDMVVNQKVKIFNKGKESTVEDVFVTVMPDSFAVGKEARDILWPPTCTVLSVKKPHSTESAHAMSVMDEGDILHIHYQTYDPSATHAVIETIVGVQTSEPKVQTHTVTKHNHIVPDV